MSKNELTRAEARELITPVVDDEVTADERKAFMDFIADHDDVRKEYESVKKIKSLICSRCPSARAPDSLKKFVENIADQDLSTKDLDVPAYDMEGDGLSNHKTHSGANPNQSSNSRRWMGAIAASLLLIAVVWGFFTFTDSSEAIPKYNVEEYAYEHFVKHDGKYVPPTISTANVGAAEIQLAQDYDMPMTIPSLKNAEFKGIVYSEFVPSFKAPMLEYHLPSEDQYIYIFAFKLDKLKTFGQLVRHQEAVKKCNKPKDFHIRNVNGKHVVSWKWNDVWYAAISNHNGNTLASLVKPLQYSPDK